MERLIKSPWFFMQVLCILGTMKYVLIAFGIFMGALIPVSVFAAPLQNHTVALQPHQAIYDIAMTSRNAGTQVLDITGRMRVMWQRGCNEWVSDNETELVYIYTDGTVIPVTSDYSTVENLRGDDLTFVMQRTTGQSMEMVKGRASIYKDGHGVVHYNQKPDEDDIMDLPANTYFPMRHTVEILDRALRQDDRFFYAPLFDGSETKEVLYVNTFIGNEHALDKHPHGILVNKAIDGNLLNSRSWDVQLAFFNVTRDNSVADYEMSIRAYENGVVSDIVVDYGQFTVRQNLVGLKKLEPQRCD